MYQLKTKCGEIIAKADWLNSCEEAVTYFSLVKRLPKKDLLKIYNISPCK